MSKDTFPAQFLSSYAFPKDQKGFGGYSGLVLSPDGRDFRMISDRSHMVEGSILRHEGQIIGVRSSEPQPLDYPDDLFAGKPVRDTEGLATDRQGRLYVALESDNVVLRRNRDGTWTRLPSHPSFDALPLNRGLEALAVTGAGDVLVIPEMSSGLTSPFDVFRYRDNQGWDIAFQITRGPGFLPVGADIDAEGRLYVLERGFGGFGFVSRVRRFDPGTMGVATGKTLFASRAGEHDNLEGIAVWRTNDGALRLTMVSDDNFRFFQKTEFVDYAVAN